MDRFIRSQGDFDSACFLYSLANAVQCLSGRKLRNEAWKRLVSRVSMPEDFLTWGKGTARFDYPEVLQDIAAEYVSVLAGTDKYKVNTWVGAAAELPSAIKANSVLVIDDEEHWLSAIDIKDEKIFLACSTVWQENPRSYEELPSPRLKRKYNKTIESQKLNIHRALLVRK